MRGRDRPHHYRGLRSFTFTFARSFVFEEFRVNAARAVIFEFGDDGGHAAEFDLFDDAFAELLVAYD